MFRVEVPRHKYKRTDNVLVFRILFCLRLLRDTLRVNLAAAGDGAVWGDDCACLNRSLSLHGGSRRWFPRRGPPSPALWPQDQLPAITRLCSRRTADCVFGHCRSQGIPCRTLPVGTCSERSYVLLRFLLLDLRCMGRAHTSSLVRLHGRHYTSGNVCHSTTCARYTTALRRALP